ncbi:hypothetical protein ABVF61_13460 [Roseibium sp. HPY-6]|uniref:hypothetical protein n=1 Tax=Roseibium sp. HPY-6 TaxID=3229852 RepID=UPI00338D496A
MLNKLENARLRVTTTRTGQVIAACMISAGILAVSAMTATSASNAIGFNQLALHESAYSGVAGVADTEKAGWRRGSAGPGMLHRLSDAEIEKRITRVVRHIAIEIDATQDQVDEIIGIVTPVAIGLKETHQQFATVGEDLRKLLLAEDVDRFAVEAIRAEKLALADEVSKKLTGVMIEVTAVLTPEQRVQLDERITEFRAMRPGFRRH